MYPKDFFFLVKYSYESKKKKSVIHNKILRLNLQDSIVYRFPEFKSKVHWTLVHIIMDNSPSSLINLPNLLTFLWRSVA